MAKDPETLAELRAVLASHMECWRAYDASVSETITRLEARLKLAGKVCEAYGELQRRRIEGGNSRQAGMVLNERYGAWLAGKDKDDGGS